MDIIGSWLNPKIPVEYIIISFIVLCLVLIVRIKYFKGHGRKHFVVNSLLGEYYFLVLCSTVFCRRNEVGHGIELIPFYKYSNIWNKVDYPHDLFEVSLNVALFVPIGLLLSGSIMNVKWWYVAIVGCCLSLIIEVLQLITRRGLCETDDVIHNTLGALIGWGLFVLVRKRIRYASVIRSATH